MKGPLLLGWRGGPAPLLLEWRGDDGAREVAAEATAAEGARPASSLADGEGSRAEARAPSSGCAPTPAAPREDEVASPREAAARERVREEGRRSPGGDATPGVEAGGDEPAEDGESAATSRGEERAFGPRGEVGASPGLSGADAPRTSSGRPEPEFDPPPPARPDPGPPPLAYPRVQNPRALATSGRLMKGAPASPVADQPSHDLLIVPKNAGFRAAEHGIRAVLSYLHTTQMLTPTSERHEGDDLVITLSPGPFSHLLFTEGVAPPGAPVVLEGTLFAGAAPRPLPWGDADRRACFWLALLGSRFHTLNDALRKRLHQILYLGPELVRGEHDPLRLSATAQAAESARVQRVAFEEF